MTEYKFGENMTIEKFLHQIGGEVVDIVEETLLDSLLVAGRRGYFFCKVTFLNTWSSTYTVYFADYKDVDAVNTLLTMWETFAACEVVETA